MYNCCSNFLEPYPLSRQHGRFIQARTFVYEMTSLYIIICLPQTVAEI